MRQVAIPMEELVPLLQLQMETAGSAKLVVTGYSMLPMLHHRKDTVLLEPLKEKPKKGDIVLYRRENGAYVLHRILKNKTTHCLCCGDNQREKEIVEESQMLAIVKAFTRNGKKYTTAHKGYRLYVALWVALHPVRGLYLGPRRLLGKLKAKLRRRKHK